MEVKVNIDDCIGCGVCTHLCSDVFEIDETVGKSRVKQQSDSVSVKEAAEACPVGAIVVKSE